MIFTWHWHLHDIDLYMTMTFTCHWPSHDIDLYMALTFTWHWPLHDADLHMAITFTCHWSSHDNDLHMTLTFTWQWHSHDIDLYTTLTLRRPWLWAIKIQQQKLDSQALESADSLVFLHDLGHFSTVHGHFFSFSYVRMNYGMKNWNPFGRYLSCNWVFFSGLSIHIQTCYAVPIGLTNLPFTWIKIDLSMMLSKHDHCCKILFISIFSGFWDIYLTEKLLTPRK